MFIIFWPFLRGFLSVTAPLGKRWHFFFIYISIRSDTRLCVPATIGTIVTFYNFHSSQMFVVDNLFLSFAPGFYQSEQWLIFIFSILSSGLFLICLPPNSFSRLQLYNSLSRWKYCFSNKFQWMILATWSCLFWSSFCGYSFTMNAGVSLNLSHILQNDVIAFLLSCFPI